jgi:Spt5 transcription elongation factor, acidic N-terminal
MMQDDDDDVELSEEGDEGDQNDDAGDEDDEEDDEEAGAHKNKKKRIKRNRFIDDVADVDDDEEDEDEEYEEEIAPGEKFIEEDGGDVPRDHLAFRRRAIEDEKMLGVEDEEAVNEYYRQRDRQVHYMVRIHEQNKHFLNHMLQACASTGQS